MDKQTYEQIVKQLDLEQIAGPLIEEVIRTYCAQTVHEVLHDIRYRSSQTPIRSIMKAELTKFFNQETKQSKAFKAHLTRTVHSILANDFRISITPVN